MNSKCIICGILFVSFKNKKTCSVECLKERKKELDKQSQQRYKNKIVKKQRYLKKEQKECYICKQMLSSIYFSCDKYSIDGLTYNCKKCRQTIKKEYNNKESSKQIRRSRENERRKNDITFKLTKNIRCAVWCSIKKNTNGIIRYLPYTIKQLKEHLENQFEPWMNWDNYGNKQGCWNIDHIKPISLFGEMKIGDESFLECWGLNNLRPLEAIENIKKGNRYG